MPLAAKLLRSEFFRNVSYQMIGTGLAQLLPFAATPILTRLYSEEDFALYTSFFAIVSILVVATGGRYHYAILLPKKNSDGIKIFTLSVYITCAYSILLLILVSILKDTTRHNLGNGIYFVPVYVFLFGLWNSISYLSIRKKTFFQNALSKVWQAVFYIFLAVVLGFLKFTLFGLVIAKTSGVFASCVYLFKKSRIKTEFPKLSELKEVAHRYLDYPKYGIIPAFLDIMSVQGLVIILTLYYSVIELGYYGLTALVLSAPLGLIGGSFKDVFYQKITSLINRKDFNGSLIFFRNSALGLLFIGLPICGTIYFFGSDIFSIVFGSKWARSGQFASMLALSFLVQLIVSPLSSVFNAANKVKIASLWQTLYFISTFLTLGISASVLQLEIDALLFVYVIHEIILYTLYLVLQYWTLKQLF